jgi:tripartite-type tricarboxylate transporter receptor subunit TctC
MVKIWSTGSSDAGESGERVAQPPEVDDGILQSWQKRRTVLAAAGLSLAIPRVGRAQERWPNRPIRIIVPYAPGGGTDIVTRRFAEAMRQTLGQPVVVENRSGANGVIGSELVARSNPDGYTLASVTVSHVYNRHIMPSVTIDPVRDFTAVSMLVSYPLVIIASTKAPFQDFRGMIEYARANPGHLTYGTTVANSSYAGASLARAAGVSMTEVPYSGGAPLATDLISGTLHTGWGSPENALIQMKSGLIRILAQSGKDRLPALSEVPTISEMGYPDFEMLGWVGLYGPARLPAAISARIHEAVMQAASNPTMRERLLEMGNYGVVEGPEPFAARTRRESTEIGRAVERGLLPRSQ